MITYNNDPLDPNYCPDPSIVAVEAFSTALTLIKDRVCTDVNAVKAYTDVQMSEINNKIIAIENIEGLTEKMSQLNELIAAVDLNGDGSLTEILEIKTIAENAVVLATSANTKSDEAKAQCVKTSQDLANFQTIINEQITVLNTSVTNLNVKVNLVESNVANLQTKVDSMEGLTTETVEGIVKESLCSDREKVVSLAQSFLAKAQELFTDSCIVEESNEDPLAI